MSHLFACSFINLRMHKHIVIVIDFFIIDLHLIIRRNGKLDTANALSSPDQELISSEIPTSGENLAGYLIIARRLGRPKPTRLVFFCLRDGPLTMTTEWDLRLGGIDIPPSDF
jgi:hypothetical protein